MSAEANATAVLMSLAFLDGANIVVQGRNGLVIADMVAANNGKPHFQMRPHHTRQPATNFVAPTLG
jgi:hypothetical protein